MHIKVRGGLLSRLLVLFSVLLVPLSLYAHEVYVLTDSEVEQATIASGFSLLEVLLNNMDRFIFWGFIGVIMVSVVFVVSISLSIERWLDPLLAKLPPYAPVIGRITIGLSLLAAAYYQAIFGPELLLIQVFGLSGAAWISGILVTTGLMIILGVYARIAAVSMLLIYGYMMIRYGSYMFTYLNYAGELLLLAVLGSHTLGFHHKKHDEERAPRILVQLKERFAPYAFLILRICFGISLIYASIYAKIIHNQLALLVASEPLAGHAAGLATVFGFTPEFLVLGAAIVEILIGLFFIFGIEIRFTSIFLIFWLSLSLWYFGEIVWPHIILIGIPLAFICYGYDKLSLEGFFFKRGEREPVL